MKNRSAGTRIAPTGMRRGEIVGLKWSDLDESRSRA